MPIAPLLAAAATHVALTFDPDLSLPRRVRQTAVAEAARIWSPYRVVVDEILPCASAPDEAVVLTVSTGRSPVGAAAGPLGAIVFADDGTPDSMLTVFLDLLMRIVARVRVWQVGEDRWPAVVRDSIIGRAIGRVLAHEIGHYVLRSREHSPTGLMRAVHRVDDLFGHAHAGFALTSSETRRLATAEMGAER
jgi:hypothetical protein